MDRTERHGEILAELADMGLSLARDLHARALAADDTSAPELALAFQRVSRSVRQTLALELRLERHRRQTAREDANDAARERLLQIHDKRVHIRRALAPLVWTEAEDDDPEPLLEALDALIHDASEDDGFLEEPVDACIERIRADLGLAPANDDGANAPRRRPEVVIWRSSG